ncbi:hypothetical protein [Bacillus sp. FJAT-28004]|uniref:hypothetical protein n=1 Tax=Bacillus sp. FJAT-28004 TaxID=1679165 RepID=UPI0006B40DDA|nr:hypothetical protein [Bacillus sp. FJAT-28004]
MNTTIDRLVHDMLAEPVEGEEQDRKPNKITLKGKQELLDWLLQPVERSLFKDEFYFKLLCAKPIDFEQWQAREVFCIWKRILNGLSSLSLCRLLSLISLI